MVHTDSLPHLVEHGGASAYPPPYTACNVSTYSFLIDADPKAIQENICNRLFNRPSGGAVDLRPVGGWAVLMFARLAHLASTDNPARQRGWMPERESGLWILLEDRKRGEVVWAIPFIFVDSDHAMVTGREVYGFPKMMGTVHIPAGPDHAAFFGTDTVVVPSYTPHTQAVTRPLWSVSLARPGGDGAAGVYGDAKSLARAATAMVRPGTVPGGPPGAACLRYLRDVRARTAKLIFFKQLRSAEAADRACYQAVVRADIRPTGFHGGRILGGAYTVSLPNYPSHPVRRDLGIDEPEVPARIGLHSVIDFQLDRGRTVWSAP